METFESVPEVGRRLPAIGAVPDHLAPDGPAGGRRFVIDSSSALVVSVSRDPSGRDQLHLEIVTTAQGTRVDRSAGSLAPGSVRGNRDWLRAAANLADYAAATPARPHAHPSHHARERRHASVVRWVRDHWAGLGLSAILAGLGAVSVLSSPAQLNARLGAARPAVTDPAVPTPSAWEQERNATQVHRSPIAPQPPALEDDAAIDSNLTDAPIWIQAHGQRRLQQIVAAMPSGWPATEVMGRAADEPLGSAALRAQWQHVAERMPSGWPATDTMRQAATGDG